MDEIRHPPHYTSHPSGVECIELTENMNFNIGNATKYVWRNEDKHPDSTVDLEKALWYVSREIERRAQKAALDKLTAKAAAVAATSPAYQGKAVFDLWLATLDPTDTKSLESAGRAIFEEITKRKG